MRADIEHYNSGWSGISLALRASEIEPLIDALRNLAERGYDGHFHLMNRAGAEDQPPGIMDIEVYLQGPADADNLFPTYGGPMPRRD